MNSLNSSSIPSKGSCCRDEFRAAYENRYTWEPGFPGYNGRCIWECGQRMEEGNFQVASNLKSVVTGIEDEEVKKAISAQLWEVAIHRVRRSFDDTHSENTFTAGDLNDVGLEVIVGGKNEGDRYRIKDKVVTQVYRHIHGTLVNIFTQSVTHTGNGYLSNTYSSEYRDPFRGHATSAKRHFTDKFEPLFNGGPFVLTQRQVKSDKFNDHSSIIEKFSFLDITQLN